MSRSLRSQRGQALVELSGTLMWLLLGALFVWQMGLIAWTAVSADNAVRTAERLVSRGDSSADAIAKGRQSLAAHLLLSGSSFQVVTDPQTGGPEVSAHVTIPVVLPAIHSGISIHETAVLPRTD